MLTAFAGLPFQIALVVRDLEHAVRDLGLLEAGPWRGYVFDGDSVEGRRSASSSKRPSWQR